MRKNISCTYVGEQNRRECDSVITPPDANARGRQLSILTHEHPKELFQEFQAPGVKCDFREPNVIRVAPAPLYNTFHEVWRFSEILSAHN